MMAQRIMIVEDSATQAEALSAVLEGAGYETAIFRDGESALAGWEECDPDLVVSDVVMPGDVDGYGVCKGIKAADPQKPVMLLTSLSDPMDIIHGLECGADNFITKPYDADDLITRIQTLLRLREARRDERFSMGVKIIFMGREFLVTANREQILDMLLTTFEEAVKQNGELRDRAEKLRRREEELEEARAELTRYAESLEARLQRVAEQIPDVLYSFRPDGSVSYVSPASRDVFGIPPEEFGMPTWSRAIHPKDRPVVMRELEQALTGEVARRTIEYRFLRDEGEVRWIRQSLVSVVNGDRSVDRIDGVARDVTAQHETERKIQLSEERYRSLVTATSQIVWTTDAEGMVVDPLPSWQDFTGQSREEVAGDGWIHSVHPDDRARAAEAWRSAVERRSAYDVEYRIRRKDGAYRLFSVRAVPVLEPDGSIREWVGTCTDITKRRAAEEEILQQSEYLRLLQSITATCAEANGLDEALPFTLEAICRRMRWDVGHAYVLDSDEGVMRPSDVWHPSPPLGFEELRRVTSETTFAAGQGTIGRVLESGEPCWVERVPNAPDFLRAVHSPDLGILTALAAPVVVGDDVVAVLEFFARDPRERDARLQEILRQVGVQVGRVWERAKAREERERSEAQLRQSQKMEAVGRLAGGVAHDFNNVLTAILSEAHFMRESGIADDEEARRSLEEISRSAQRAADLTRQLLTFSRQDLTEPRVLDPNELVNGLRGMLVRIIGEDIDLDVSLDHEVAPILGDKGQLEQVLVNLAVNARDAMPGGGKLTIGVGRADLDLEYANGHRGVEPGRYVLISVSDSGMGMPKEVQ
ncbi:MAG: PAS domain-containing protein, partial [Longimicrobiales bacterium]|nr:PAS domain-containing protein [Longimicrobiales bacterium]